MHVIYDIQENLRNDFKNLVIIIIKCTHYKIQPQNCNHHCQVKN